jgi:thiamine pyrophosphate-dependent acetolactate synthase large subunit-like protein
VELVKLTGSPIFHGVKYRHWNLVDPKYDGGAANHLGFMAAMNKPQPDLVILLACRTGMYFGGRNGFIPPTEDCKYIQVDTDGGEIGRTRPIDVGIVADLSEVLSALCHEIAHTPFHTDPAWIEIAVNTQREVVAPASKEPTDISPGRMNVYHALKEAFSSLEPGSIICIDGGETSLWGADLLPFARPHLSFGALGYLVLLGNGFGWSLGAAIADPSRQVVNLQGDGSAGFHFSSLDTYARFQLNILTVVVNNAVWAMSIHGQELFYGEKDPARNVSRLSPETRYDIIAEGFGNAAAMVNKFDEIRGEVKRLSQDPRPACLNLIVAETPIHPATKAFMNENPDPNVINVPYYDSIPRPFYKV